MQITVIRHGQTPWNSEGRMQGHTDIALCDTGLAQGEKVAARLAKEPCDIIYTSDLVRAVKTAEFINSHHNVPLVKTAALREVSFGIFEGRIYDEAWVEMAQYDSLEQDYPQGESNTNFVARINAFMDEVTRAGHKNIFIVAHGGTISAIICYLLKQTYRRFKYHVSNTSIYRFELVGENGFVMTIENDTAHLDGLSAEGRI